MTDHHDRLDEWLSRDAGAIDIVPSSGFAERVMTAVRESADAPPPIPFPWLRVLPWAAVAIALVMAAVVRLVTGSAPSSADAEWPTAWLTQIQSASPDVVWTTVGVLLSLVTIAFALRAGGRRRAATSYL